MTPDWAALLEADRRHVWHPYGPMPAALTQRPVVRASGTEIELAGGTVLLDAMSSWWCAIHGHAHPQIVAAVSAQMQVLPHVMFGGLTHEPAIRLAQRLLELAPEGLQHVFFADSGSVSVEVALKMVIQAQGGRGHAGRERMVALRGAYHGDTAGAMAVCDPDGGMHAVFGGHLTEHVFLDRPPAGYDEPVDPGWVQRADAAIAARTAELAAVIVEPVVQGAGGMHVYNPGYLVALRELCDEYDLLLVADEIATGFGRTGRLFGCEHAGVRPDVMCVGKALTGGTMTLAAALCTAEVAAAIGDGPGGALMHGPTFMANPLACAAALASLELLAAGGWASDVARVEHGLRVGLRGACEISGVADARVLGAIGVLQLDHPVDVPAATAAAIGHGVWLRPFRDLVYAMPPYVCDDDEIARICVALRAAAEAG